VSATGLSVGYGALVVVDGIDLTVEPGDVVALVGTNGSGKSTLLKTIVGLLPPMRGDLAVLGSAPGASPAKVAYVSQFHPNAFVLPLRARDVVRMGRFAEHGLLGRMGPVDDELVDGALRRLAVSDLARRPLRDLSGGQQQRIYLAQALARRAELLVLDEPTAGVDARGREIYEQAIAVERERGAAVVVATHDIGEASRADHVVLLAGRVVAHGPPEQVLDTEHLLETFGVSIRRLEGGWLQTEEPHGHEH
jgi:ABC-type Mn2+/Zn2+ transport system ATPase subunit